jgi:hypothetical protein
VAIAFAVSGALLTYFAQIEAEATTDSLFEYSDDDGTTWYDAEEYDDSWTLTGLVGGDSTSETFDLKLSADADSGHTAYFHLSLVGSLSGAMTIPDDGVTVYIEDSADNTVTDFAFSPGDQEQFEVHIELDEMLQAETFTLTIDIDNA